MVKLNGESQKGDIHQLLAHFKDYAISHRYLTQVDNLLMNAIREPAGFAHVLVYGPSGVGKSTMIRQIAKRLNGNCSTLSQEFDPNPQWSSSVPLLLMETRPPDGGVFNRADYYRTALKLLGEPFYEQRFLVDVNIDQTWQKKGGSRSKTAQFNDSPELRHALEAAIVRRGVRAVILDEAQHLLKIGSGRSAGKLIDQLDWIKSMTNVTGVLHILIGTYELLNLRNLSAQASRRGLDIHFPRYQWQQQADCQHFQSVLLALFKEVPLKVDLANLMQHWSYFYERSIGCVGVLKDWLVRTIAAVLHEGHDALTLAHMQKHALTLAQCGRMALEAVEGEKQLEYDESQRETLWSLLQAGMSDGETPLAPGANSGETSSVSGLATSDSISAPSPTPTKTSRQKRTSKSAKAISPSSENTSPSTTRQKRTTKTKTATINTLPLAETDTQTEEKSAPKKKKPSKRTKKTAAAENEIVTVAETDLNLSGLEKEQILASNQEQPPVRKKTNRRIGQRKPKRDPVGD